MRLSLSFQFKNRTAFLTYKINSLKEKKIKPTISNYKIINFVFHLGILNS